MPIEWAWFGLAAVVVIVVGAAVIWGVIAARRNAREAQARFDAMGAEHQAHMKKIRRELDRES